eukprot:8262213-Pyramimonas_sp.AAC.1
MQRGAGEAQPYPYSLRAVARQPRHRTRTGGSTSTATRRSCITQSSSWRGLLLVGLGGWRRRDGCDLGHSGQRLIPRRSSSGTSEGTDPICVGISRQLLGRVGPPEGCYSKRRRAVHHCSWEGVSRGAQRAVQGYSHADFIAAIRARFTCGQQFSGGISE